MANKNKTDQHSTKLAKELKQSIIKPEPINQSNSQGNVPSKIDQNKLGQESPGKYYMPITEEEVLIQQILNKHGISKRQLASMMANGEIKLNKKKTGKKCMDEFKVSNVLTLALLGFRPGTIAKILGIGRVTLFRHMKFHKEFKELFAKNRESAIRRLFAKAWSKVDEGHWPAIEFFITSMFGDIVKEQHRGLGKDEELDDDFKGEVDEEVQVKVIKYKRKIDTKILEDIMDGNDNDTEAVRIHNISARELGEAIDIEYSEEKDDEKSDSEKKESDRQQENKSEKKTPPKRRTEGPEETDYY